MKRRALVVTLLTVVALASLGAQGRKVLVAGDSPAGIARARTQAVMQAALDQTGYLDGVAYRIVVPENWNGTLLVFAHGTQLGSPTPVVAPPNVELQLLGLGYALAGSGFSNSNKDGVVQTHALTSFFRDTVANPRRIIIWGNSLGGLITLKLIEKFPGIYDGAIANCTPSSGAAENLDSALAFGVAFDATFGWPEDKWGPLRDVRDDLAVPDVLPLVQQLADDPANFPKWEFIRLAMHLSSAAFWTKDPGTGYEFYKLQMWKATVLRSAAERENGGRVAENVGMHYTVDADDASLALSGLTREQVDTMLDRMNDNANIEASRPARMHLEQWGAPTGDLRRPVITMHHKDDGMAFVTAETYYKGLVEGVGAGDNLLQTYTQGAPIGHCSFTPLQYTAALSAIDYWLKWGLRPPASFFPAAKGFTVTFVPGPWIF